MLACERVEIKIGAGRGVRVGCCGMVVREAKQRGNQSTESWIDRLYSCGKDGDMQVCERESVRWTRRQQNSQARLRTMRGDK